jgi:putative intracellular protease/amidase
MAAVYLVGALFPPLVAGVVMTASSLSHVMVHRAPRPPEAGKEPAAPALDPGKPNVVVVLSNEGTELLDFLGPYALFAATGHWNVVTAAPERRPSPTTGALGILPDFSLAGAPEADVIVLPAIMDPHNPAIADWIRGRAHRARKVVAPCEGARLAAGAGILAGRRATSHFLALPELKEKHPDVTWDPAARVVSDEKVLTSAGISGSLDAALTAIAELEGDLLAHRAAKGAGLPLRRGAQRPSELGGPAFARLLIEAAYDWDRRSVVVPLEAGVDELGLAGPLEVLPRTMSMRVFTVSARREWTRSRHGLQLIATDDAASAPPHDHRIDPPAAPASGQVLDRMFDLVATERGADVARVVARLIEYPWTASQDARGARETLPVSIVIRVALLAVLGLVLARWVARSYLKLR